MPTLHWTGKNKVVNHHHDVPYRVLRHDYRFHASGDTAAPTGNKIIHGDNLEALKSLLPEYEGQIKCIYIDPPYNTGNEGWVYNDAVNDPKIKKWLGQVVGKEGEDLSRHDKWLCMMYPRLKLLQRLLADDGAIFVSIDDNEAANLRLLMDEIFGVSNFIGDIIWQHSVQAKGYSGTLSLHHNHTLVYGRSLFQLNDLARTDEHNVNYSNPDNDPRGLWRSGDVRNALVRPNLMYDITTPSGKIIRHPQKGWRFSRETFERELAEGKIVFSKDESRIIRKIYLADQTGRVSESIWFATEAGTTREATAEVAEILGRTGGFDTPKPTRLIERILQVASKTDSIILDSFAGSGTTAHAVAKLNAQDGGNRKFILIEMMDYAETITAERVRRVMQGYGSGEKAVAGLGGGFDFYTVGEPLLQEDGNLNEAVGLNELRRYIGHTEGVKPQDLLPPDNLRHPALVGEANGCACFFHYQPDVITTLNMDFLATLNWKPEAAVIYADNCVLADDFLRRHRLHFKKIPRDIHRI
jgi:adenine-specific DNA-methyltransferase